MSTLSVSAMLSYSRAILLIFNPLAEKRKAEAERIRQKYPDRIPVSIYGHTPCQQGYLP